MEPKPLLSPNHFTDPFATLYSCCLRTAALKDLNKKRPQSSKSLCPLVIANTSEAFLYDNISVQIVQLENNIVYSYS